MDLLTERTKLIKYTTSDFESFCKVICNDEVMLHISGKGNSRKIARKKFNRLLKTNQKNRFYGIYKVILKETNSVIGFAKMVPFEDDKIEIGYALLPDYWRLGYTNEMVKRMLKNGNQNFRNKKLIAIVNEENIGSLKVLENLNFHKYKKEPFKGSPCYFLEYIG